MKSRQGEQGQILPRAVGFILAIILTVCPFPLNARAADSYTSVKSGTVSWQMIHDNPNTYYWIDSDGYYCALAAIRSGGYYYVTLYRPGKSNGTELRYLRQDKDDDSGSEHEWDSASAKYTGGYLYVKGSGGDSDSGDDSGSGSGSGTTAGNVAQDGTYEATGTVSFSKDTYSFKVTVTVSGGKITNVTQVLTTTPKETKSRTEYQPEAMTALLNNLKNKDATTEAVDAVSSGTPKYSYAALKQAVRDAISNAPKTDSGSGSGSGETGFGITNPSTQTNNDNGLRISKTLSYDEGSKTYTITLKARATQTPQAYTNISNKQNYTYSTLTNGNYYYSADGINFYVLEGYKKKKEELYINAIVGSKYYGLKDDGSFHDDSSDQDKGDKVKKTSDTFLKKGFDYTQYIYVKSSSGGTSYGTATALKDKVDTSVFDTSGASVSASPSGTSVTNNLSSSGRIVVTGYNYTGNVNSDLTVTISGLKPKVTSSGSYSSNDGDAGLYANSSATSALVSISSPTVQLTPSTYTVTWKSQDGASTIFTNTAVAGAKPSFEGITPVKAADSTYSYTFVGWNTRANQTTGTAAADLPAVTADMTYYAAFARTTLPASHIDAGTYGDNTATVQKYNYQPIVAIDVDENGVIRGITADADTNVTNLSFLADALDGILQQINNQPASAAQNIDTVSGATYASNALITEIKKALAEDPKGPYTLVWNSDGTAVKTVYNVKYGTRTPDYDGTEPAKASSGGNTYAFTGWDPAQKAVFVTENVTYNAQFTSTSISYTITYNLAGGTVTGGTNPTSYNVGSSAITLINPIRDGYDFTGWTGTGLGQASMEVTIPAGSTGNRTYTATWTEHVDAAADGKYIDGTTQVSAFEYKPYVTVTVENGKIKSIDVTTDQAGYNKVKLDEAAAGLSSLIGKDAKPASVDTNYDAVSGATYSSNALKEAVKKALAAENTVTWKDHDSTILDQAKITTGTIPQYVNDEPQRTDYTFTGWSPEMAAVTADTEYTAAYNQNNVTYTITYHLNGGTVSGGTNPDTYTSQSDPITLINPTRDGYDFVGWSGTDLDMNSLEVVIPTGSTGDRDYAAVWEEHVDDAADGLYMDGTTKVEKFAYIPYVTVTVKDGKIESIDVFSDTTGTNLKKLNDAISGLDNLIGKEAKPASADLYYDTVSGATYSCNALKEAVRKALAAENTIEWQDDDGTTLASAKISDGTVPRYPGADPAREDYTFTGWTPEATAVTSDTTYTAVYAANTVTYTITYNLDGGAVANGDNPTEYTSEDAAFSLLNPTKDGYDFAGWTGTDLDGKTMNVTILAGSTGDRTYTANWTVHIDPVSDGRYIDGTTQVSTYGYHPYVAVTVTDGKITAIDVTAEDVGSNTYFLNNASNWIKGLIGKDAVTASVDNLDAVSGATYTKNALREAVRKALEAENTISWKDHDGTTLETAKITTGTTPVYTGEDPYRDGYNFTGWTPAITAVTGSTDYTAAYEEANVEYNVTYDLDGGTGTIKDDTGHKAGDSVAVVSGEPTKKGYKFQGWKHDVQTKLLKAGDTFTMPASNTSLTAVWKEWYEAGVYGIRYIVSDPYTYEDTEIVVSVEVDDNNTIVDVTAYMDPEADSMQELPAALEYVNGYDVLAGMDIALEGPDSLEAQYYAADMELGSDAPAYAKEIIGGVMEALQDGLKGPYTITIKDASNPDGDPIATIDNIRYGTETATIEGLQIPAKAADDSGTYTFNSYTTTPDAVVTDNITLLANFDLTPALTGHTIYFEDYTKGGATIGGIETEALTGMMNCYKTTTTQTGETTFTLSADNATVAAIHTNSDGSAMTGDNLLDQNGSYERLTCTAVEGSANTYQFTVPVDSEDVYVVLAYKGDVDLNGTVNLKDSTCTSKIYVGAYSSDSTLKEFVGDVDGKNGVNLKDSTFINKAYIGTYETCWDISSL